MPTTVTIASIADATEGGNAGTFRVTRSDTSGSLSVSLSYSGTGSGDYWADPIFVMFSNGQATADITINALDDSTSEPTETVICTVNSSAFYTVGTPGSATMNLFDNDAQVVTVEKVNDAAEGGTGGKFRFTRIGDLSGSLTVNYSVGGTASSGTDFTALSGSVTFAANAATADVNVAALHDGVNDASETVVATVTSGTGYSVGSPASATVNVIDTDILPIAYDGGVTASVNTPIELEVLDLSTSLYGDELTVTGVTQGEDGSVSIDGETVTYTPDTDFVGEDSFTFTVEDEFGNEATGTVYVTITGIAAPPVSIWTDEEEPVNIDITEVAFDLDEDELTVTAVTQGSDGTVTIETDGTITYTPNTSFAGEDSFTYTVEDPDGNEATGTITVTVGETDPVALDDSVATAVNTPVNVEVLDLAFQPAGGGLTTTSVTQGDHGTVTIEVDGSVTYTPDTSYTGTDTFTYTVTDGNSNTGTGTITVQVGPADPDDVDEIIEDLGDIEDEIDNYDVNDPPELVTAASAIASAISGYRSEVMSFINANGIDLTGPLGVAIGQYRKMLAQGTALQTLHGALDGMLLASKALVEDLAQQFKTAALAGNMALAASLAEQYSLADQAHKHAMTAVVQVRKAWLANYLETDAEYRALQRSYPGSAAVLNLNPPTLPTLGDIERWTPKLP